MSDMASSPLTTEDTMVTSIINETSVHMDATCSDSVVTEINDQLEPNMRDTDKGNNIHNNVIPLQWIERHTKYALINIHTRLEIHLTSNTTPQARIRDI